VLSGKTVLLINSLTTVNVIAKWMLVLVVAGLYVTWLIGLVDMNRKLCGDGKMRRWVGISLFIVLGLLFSGSFAIELIMFILRF
jgi:hypothetical protein